MIQLRAKDQRMLKLEVLYQAQKMLTRSQTKIKKYKRRIVITVTQK